MRITPTACIVLLFGATAAHDAAAQSAAAAPGRIEASGGGSWIGRTSTGAADADETTPSNGSLRIFSTSSDLAAAPSFDVRVGVRVTRALAVEAETAYSRPELRVAISGDIESAAATTAVERIQQYLIGGGVVWYLPAPRWPRLAPFVSGGGGYLRQLHEQALLVQTGRYFQIGGGVAYLLASRPDGRLKATGVRVDARAVVRRDGVAFDGGSHAAPAVGASFFVRF